VLYAEIYADLDLCEPTWFNINSQGQLVPPTPAFEGRVKE